MCCKVKAGRATTPRTAFLRSSGTTCLAIALLGLGAFFRHQANAPRDQALAALSQLNDALTGDDTSALIGLTAFPPSFATRATDDQARWVAGVLSDEVSNDGIAKLRRQARFGPLLEIFPAEAARWAEVANLPASECVAFRLERAGTRAEVVLHQSSSGFRVLRCNNVRQMAAPLPSGL